MLRPMTDARHRWVFPDPMRLEPGFREAARAAGLGTFAATVLARRGVADEAALDAFLGPAIAGLHDPRLLPDAALVVERIARARAGGERVMVFGDFDADGLTGLAQLVIALRRLGIDTIPYVPSRLEEGHGLSLAAVDRRGRRRGRADHHRRHGVHERRGGGRRPRARHRRHRHGPPPPARRAAGGDRAREPPAGGLGLPGTPPCRGAASRSPSRGCSSASWRTRRARRSTSPTWRRSGPSRTSRR